MTLRMMIQRVRFRKALRDALRISHLTISLYMFRFPVNRSIHLSEMNY